MRSASDVDNPVVSVLWYSRSARYRSKDIVKIIWKHDLWLSSTFSWIWPRILLLCFCFSASIRLLMPRRKNSLMKTLLLAEDCELCRHKLQSVVWLKLLRYAVPRNCFLAKLAHVSLCKSWQRLTLKEIWEVAYQQQIALVFMSEDVHPYFNPWFPGISCCFIVSCCCEGASVAQATHLSVWIRLSLARFWPIQHFEFIWWASHQLLHSTHQLLAIVPWWLVCSFLRISNHIAVGSISLEPRYTIPSNTELMSKRMVHLDVDRYIMSSNFRGQPVSIMHCNCLRISS